MNNQVCQALIWPGLGLTLLSPSPRLKFCEIWAFLAKPPTASSHWISPTVELVRSVGDSDAHWLFTSPVWRSLLSLLAQRTESSVEGGPQQILLRLFVCFWCHISSRPPQGGNQWLPSKIQNDLYQYTMTKSFGVWTPVHPAGWTLSNYLAIIWKQRSFLHQKKKEVSWSFQSFDTLFSLKFIFYLLNCSFWN